MRLPLLLAVTLAIAGCSAPPPAAAAEPRFDLFTFFSGRTHGEAQLKVMLKGSQAVTVEGRGRIEGGDTLILDQTVTEAGKPPRERRWRMQQSSPGFWSGTLSDATGPVTASVDGNRLHIEFAAPRGLAVEQWLTLAPDGRSAHNLLTAHKFGVQVATLDETITKLD